ncbi:MAG: hypothetical protein AAF567_03555 [Actinomycetota bacterium]
MADGVASELISIVESMLQEQQAVFAVRRPEGVFADWAPNPEAFDRAVQLIEAEREASVLYAVLALDGTLDVPVTLVINSYRRLIALGVQDPLTFVCYGHYLRLHGYDEEAARVLDEVRDRAIAEHVWDPGVLHPPQGPT